MFAKKYFAKKSFSQKRTKLREKNVKYKRKFSRKFSFGGNPTLEVER